MLKLLYMSHIETNHHPQPLNSIPIKPACLVEKVALCVGAFFIIGCVAAPTILFSLHHFAHLNTIPLEGYITFGASGFISLGFTLIALDQWLKKRHIHQNQSKSISSGTVSHKSQDSSESENKNTIRSQSPETKDSIQAQIVVIDNPPLQKPPIEGLVDWLMKPSELLRSSPEQVEQLKGKLSAAAQEVPVDKGKKWNALRREWDFMWLHFPPTESVSPEWEPLMRSALINAMNAEKDALGEANTQAIDAAIKTLTESPMWDGNTIYNPKDRMLALFTLLPLLLRVANRLKTDVDALEIQKYLPDLLKTRWQIVDTFSYGLFNESTEKTVPFCLDVIQSFSKNLDLKDGWTQFFLSLAAHFLTIIPMGVPKGDSENIDKWIDSKNSTSQSRSDLMVDFDKDKTIPLEDKFYEALKARYYRVHSSTLKTWYFIRKTFAAVVQPYLEGYATQTTESEAHYIETLQAISTAFEQMPLTLERIDEKMESLEIVTQSHSPTPPVNQSEKLIQVVNSILTTGKQAVTTGIASVKKTQKNPAKIDSLLEEGGKRLKTFNAFWKDLFGQDLDKGEFGAKSMLLNLSMTRIEKRTFIQALAHRLQIFLKDASLSQKQIEQFSSAMKSLLLELFPDSKDDAEKQLRNFVEQENPSQEQREAFSAHASEWIDQIPMLVDEKKAFITYLRLINRTDDTFEEIKVTVTTWAEKYAEACEQEALLQLNNFLQKSSPSKEETELFKKIASEWLSTLKKTAREQAKKELENAGKIKNRDAFRQTATEWIANYKRDQQANIITALFPQLEKLQDIPQLKKETRQLFSNWSATLRSIQRLKLEEYLLKSTPSAEEKVTFSEMTKTWIESLETEDILSAKENPQKYLAVQEIILGILILIHSLKNLETIRTSLSQHKETIFSVIDELNIPFLTGIKKAIKPHIELLTGSLGAALMTALKPGNFLTKGGMAAVNGGVSLWTGKSPENAVIITGAEAIFNGLIDNLKKDNASASVIELAQILKDPIIYLLCGAAGKPDTMAAKALSSFEPPLRELYRSLYTFDASSAPEKLRTHIQTHLDQLSK